MDHQEPAYWQVMKPYVRDIDIYQSPETYMASIANVPRPMVLIYAADFCLSEVHNGGLLQFFWNSTGVLAPEAAEGFDALGMFLLGAILKQASALLGEIYPRDRSDRWDALLLATGRDTGNLRTIFEANTDRYLAFAKVTENLPFDEWDKQIWELAKTENGGFGNAAFKYLKEL